MLVALEMRAHAARMRGCAFRVRLNALSPAPAVLVPGTHSRLHELGCTLRLDECGVGECALEVPTSLALVSPHCRVTLTADVASPLPDAAPDAAPDPLERARSEWPERDLFTATLAPDMALVACEHE